MPKKATELSVKTVEKLARVDGWHAVGGAVGLLLQVRGDQARSWILRVVVQGRRRVMGLGSYDDLSLADARRKARELRSAIANGRDPLEEKRARRQAVQEALSVLTFDEAARRYIRAKSHEWRNPKHGDQWRNTLSTYASPVIGKMRVDAIEMRHIERILEPIWVEKTETASRLRGRIESVLDWATAGGHRTGDNPARWKGALEHRLAKPGKVKKIVHHKALPIDDLHGFVADLRLREGIAARALEFLILTAARTGEVRGATWAEIDLAGATWTIPGQRMKAGKEHRVPLCQRALAILAALPRMAGTNLVFPGTRNAELSNMSLSACMRRMGVDAVPHGFRSTFRDWAAERTAYPAHVAEMALAHTIGDKVEAAYRRGDLLANRTRMMADWEHFIETPPATGNVVAMRKAG